MTRAGLTPHSSAHGDNAFFVPLLIFVVFWFVLFFYFSFSPASNPVTQGLS